MRKRAVDIGIVIVTFNRIDCLKKALDNYDTQTVSPKYVVVVNNHSSDGTEEYLNDWEAETAEYKKIVINLEYNTGGSGGYYRGLKEAEQEAAEWIWVSDDDAFPDKDALERAIDYIDSNANGINISAICGSVIENGNYALEHRRTINLQKPLDPEEISSPENYRKKQFEINAFSYVGTIINREKLRQAGLPLKDYFILCDDTEHSLRLSKLGRILCVPEIMIYHYPKNVVTELSWKTYYGIRNYYNMLKRHMSKTNFFIAYGKKKLALLKYRFKSDTKEYYRIAKTALDDAMNDKLGIHEIYRPGWTYIDEGK